MSPALVTLAAAVATTLLVLAAARRWAEHRERQQLLRRLQGPAAHGHAEQGAAARQLFRPTGVPLGRWWRLVQRTTLLEDSGQLLEQAGLNWSSARLTRMTVLAGLAGSGIGFLAGGLVTPTLLGFAAGIAAPSVYVRRRRARRLRVMEEQLPEAIELLGRAIRAGHALSIALRLVAEESPDPLASEFRRTFEEQRYGRPFEESLLALTRRVDLVDLRVMVVALLVQREVGGNLAEILDKIAHLIRARFSLRRQVRVYTAQGRMSGWVLGCMPVGLAGVIYLLNPEYLAVLAEDPLGRTMLVAAVGLQSLGYLWIWRILKLEL